MREQDIVDLVTLSRDHRVLMERDRLQLGREQIQVNLR